MEKTLVGNGTLITLGKENKVIKDGAALIEGNLIKNIGTTAELKKNKFDQFIDASGKVIMPGMINTHMHLYSTFARGMALKDESPSNFVEILERLWWRLDKALTPDSVYYSALIPLIDCIKSGTTTIVDHHASPFACKGSLDWIANAMRETGVRACLCYETSDRDGPEIANEGIGENERFIKLCQKEGNGLLSSTFGLHASFTLSDETLSKCVEVAKKLGVGFHVHVAEDKADVDDSLKKYKKRVLERFKDLEVLGPKTIAAHCVHIDANEMDILKNTGTNVVHNPESNMGNAVGCAPVLEMIGKDITVGMGTDGFTSSMFTELKVANILHKLIKGDPRVGYGEVLKMCFANNPKIVQNFFPKPLGEISPGAYADLILVDYLPPTPFSADNFLGHLLFGISNAVVDTTIVNGKVLMQGRKLVGLDEAAIAQKSSELASKLWERF
jgi:putative selenium metabolism protein SsnA